MAAATGAMLVGRRTSDVGERMQAEDPGSVDYPFSGPVFVLTHRPPQEPPPGITYLSGDISEAVATARAAAGGKDVEILGADVAGQCLERGLVDEILVYVLPVLLGDGIGISASRAAQDRPGAAQQQALGRGERCSGSDRAGDRRGGYGPHADRTPPSRRGAIAFVRAPLGFRPWPLTRPS